MSWRAFVAIPVPADPRLRALHDTLAKAGGSELKLTDPDHLHLTFSFLGNVDDDDTPDLEEAIVHATRHLAPFEVTLRGAGAFPTIKKPHVVWAGCSESARLTALAQRLRESLTDAGAAPDDKPFKAHVTLGRVRQGHFPGPRLGEALRANAETELGTLPVTEVRLYRSTLTPAGAIYDVVAAGRLGAR